MIRNFLSSNHKGLHKLFCIAVTLSVLCSSFLYAQRTDGVILRNGNEITGEIKKLELGRLEYSTDDMSTINIEWDKILKIWSKDRFHIEVETGERYTGSIDKAEEDGEMVAVTDAGPVILELINVVRIYSLEASFFQRLKGHLDAGFSYQKANKLTQFTLGAELSYHTQKNETKLNLDSYISDQEDVESTTRNSGSLQFGKYLPNKWMALVFASAQQNEELGLALRANIGAGAGRFLIQTNRMIFIGSGALTVNRENYTESEEITYNLEAILGVNFTTFRLDTPKMDVSSSLLLIPSITDLGRVRIEFDANVSYEIFKDFFFGIGIFDDYDSRPPVVDEATEVVKNDFGVDMTISWKFK